MEDLFNFSEKKNKSAKSGRRAQKTDPDGAANVEANNATTITTSQSPNEETDEFLSTISDKTPKDDVKIGGKRMGRRTSGWGADDQPKFGRRKANEKEQSKEDERFNPTDQSRLSGSDNDSDNDIPVIPDLEEQQPEVEAPSIAIAPTVAVNQVATYRELDNEFLEHSAFQSLDNNIDLKLLSRNLSAQADIYEEDKLWDWDTLFTEVSSELKSEWEKSELLKEENQ